MNQDIKGWHLAVYCLFCGIVINSVNAADTEVNVALAKWGTTATANSIYDGSYSATKVIDGKWESRQTDKWNSAQGNGTYWIILDLGVERQFNKVVVHHEEAQYVTSDFCIQKGESSNGPWVDLVAPVTNNQQQVSEHRFDLTEGRFIRLFITKAEQNSSDYARIFEIEVFSPAEKTGVLLGIEPVVPFEYVQAGGESKKKYKIDVYNPLAPTVMDVVTLTVDGENVAVWQDYQSGDVKDVLLSFSEQSTVEALIQTDGQQMQCKRQIVVRRPFFMGGTVHLIQASHQDIAWLDDPAACQNFRNESNIIPALEFMHEIPDYSYSIEQTMYLMDFIRIYPERQDEIYQVMRQGRFEWGGTYNQPYHDVLSSEQLVRQTYLGRKWLKKNFPGCDTKVAFNTDVPGTTMQMPQILAKSGIPYFMISRHYPGIYNWESPDGSKVLCYSKGHYYEDASKLGFDHHQIAEKNDEKIADAMCVNLQTILDNSAEEYADKNFSPEMPLWLTRDASSPISLKSLVNKWQQRRQETPLLPGIKRSSATNCFDALVSNRQIDVPTVKGERPNMWLYIHGPTHERAITAKRQAGIYLPAAEKFATIDAILNGSMADYPSAELDDAWRNAIYPDHGWGGNKGEITDYVFREKLKYARDVAKGLYLESIHNISAAIKHKKSNPIVVFNHLSWARADIVQCLVNDAPGTFTLADINGNPVSYQATGRREGGKYEICFLAEDVPSVGYKSYYMINNTASEGLVQTAAAKTLDTPFYQIVIGKGGLQKVYDKQLACDIFNTDQFTGGEVFVGESVGNGAGEFSQVQQPSFKDIDRMRDHEASISPITSGPVFSTFTIEQKLKDATVRQTYIVYNDIKRIDCLVDLLGWQGPKSREFRMAIPVDIKEAAVSYEVPMGVVTVGEDEIKGDSEYFTTYGENVHPRSMQNFATASGDTFAVTMSASTAVFDWQDPLDEDNAMTVLQPILLASRKSCHGAGPWYLQPGDHHYTFSITSHAPGWKEGYKTAISANQPLTAVVASSSKNNIRLKPEQSFFKVSADNLMITAIKKCEDDDSVVVRLYDIEGKDTMADLQTDFSIKKAQSVNLIEEEAKHIPSKKNRLDISIGHHAIETYKLNIK